MAKGNMLQGMARGKVGDVVFSRLNGEQIARVRNRNPKNPRTNAQLYQRAIMATVMRAYSAGKVIFDHSFQGKAVGEENQRHFMSENAKHLRSLIADDINSNTEVNLQQGRVVGPGVATPVPGLYKVSEGSLVNTLISFEGNNARLAAAPTGVTKLKDYCAALGLQANDIYTFVAFQVPYRARTIFQVIGVDDNGARQFECKFLWARYQIKAAAFESTAALNTAKVSDLLEFSDGNFTPLSLDEKEFAGDNTVDYTSLTGEEDGTFTWIRSRKDEDLRSTAEMVFMNVDHAQYGLVSSYALTAWKQGTESVGDSDLILEGGNE